MSNQEDIIDDLNALQEEIEKAELEKAKEEGKLDGLMRQLEKFGVKSIKAAEKELEKIKKEVRQLKEEIDEDYSKLKKEYTW